MNSKTIVFILVGVALIAGAFALGNFYASWQMQQYHARINGGFGTGCCAGGGMMGGNHHRSGGMMGGWGSSSGSAAPAASQGLRAVSQDGALIPLAADAEKILGKLAQGSAAQKVGDMIVVLSLNPYPATMRQLTEFTVALKDAQGKAVNDAEVSLNLTMPSMWMPPNSPALKFLSDGNYVGTGQFTMRGWWRVEVVIVRGGQTQSAFFDLDL